MSLIFLSIYFGSISSSEATLCLEHKESNVAINGEMNQRKKDEEKKKDDGKRQKNVSRTQIIQ